MSEIGHKILVVDDQQSNRDIIGKIMDEKYQLNFATTGEECITLVESWSPDVILMDVTMPGMGGLEACRVVREHSNGQSLSVIFLSSMSEISERLAGYEAGGDDYIGKPFNHDELLKKVELALENINKIDSFKQSSNDAMSMAMTAMSQASDVGCILRFYRDSFIIDTVEALAKLLSETVSDFGVNGIVYFNVNGSDFFYSSSGVVKPLEQSAIENLRERGRIYSFSKRTIFNYGAASVLIVDMPIENEIKYGELKDNIAILVEGAEARVNSLVVQINREEKQQENIRIIKATRVSLEAIERQQQESLKSHQALMADLVNDIQESFTRLGLSDEQERELMAMIEIVESESNKLFGKNNLLNEKIASVMTLLN